MTKVKSLLILTVALFMGINLSAQSKKASDILGIWFNEEKDAKIKIYEEKGMYYGKVIWLEEPNEPDTGLPKLDDENPDEEMQKRPIMGLLLVKDFVFDGDDVWDDGEIYDPKSGNTYSCYIKFDSKDKLKVRGYIGISWIGRTTYWTRTTE
ncbi:MAG: DUF2147 domain-containing protein [Bacteroidales bacterium]|nr:DUF2147 domain-containing protein [Bacteroidales bacterium]MCF8403533.1 DUF2147 domain-containing protein [Bacteroidales bacterium]